MTRDTAHARVIAAVRAGIGGTRLGRVWVGLARAVVAGAVAGASLVLLAAHTPAAAADPSPAATPHTFGSPQYLVYWVWHGTMDGPVTDESYALFDAPPVDFESRPGPDGKVGQAHFRVPDGMGGVYHYYGEIVGGPFATDVEACVHMRALGITSLEAWPPGEGTVDCSIVPLPGGGSSGGGSAGGGSTSGTLPGGILPGDAIRVGAGLAGGLLAVGGVVGLVRRRPGVPSPSGNDHPQQPASPPDPCAAEVAAVHAATTRGRLINDLLATNRSLSAFLDRQIVQLANVMIPGSFGLDVAFILGGQWGSKLGVGYLPKELLGKALDSAIKDIVKEAAKQGLDAAGQNALDIDRFHAELAKGGGKATEGGAKALLKDFIKSALMSHATTARFADPSGSPQQLQARLQMLDEHATNVAGPMADALGHVLSMYNAGIGVATLMEKLDILRIKRDTVLDQTATLEVEMEDILDKAKLAGERLAHCRTINAPDWRP